MIMPHGLFFSSSVLLRVVLRPGWGGSHEILREHP
jgi:hypothetical protein